VVAVAFLVVIPQGSAVALAVARSLNPNYPNPKIVISTEAAHAFVSGEVEKSASLSDPPKNNSFYCLYYRRNLFFTVFSPKIACQALEPFKPLPINNIRLAF
jgi:hypothetical protein